MMIVVLKRGVGLGDFKDDSVTASHYSSSNSSEDLELPLKPNSSSSNDHGKSGSEEPENYSKDIVKHDVLETVRFSFKIFT